MRTGRHGNRDGVHLSQKSAAVRQNLEIAAGGGLPGVLLREVGDADHPTFRHFQVLLDMVATQMAGSHDADSDLFHNLSTGRFPFRIFG